MNSEEKLKYLVDRISKKKGVEAIFLFGSRANGRIRKDSDYDIAVLTKHVSREKELEITGLGNEIFDISLFNNLPLIIQFRIIKEGKMLFCRNSEAVLRAKRYVIRNYLDFLPLLVKSYNKKIYDLRQN